LSAPFAQRRLEIFCFVGKPSAPESGQQACDSRALWQIILARRRRQALSQTFVFSLFSLVGLIPEPRQECTAASAEIFWANESAVFVVCCILGSVGRADAVSIV
jgi:hypothetical protein